MDFYLDTNILIEFLRGRLPGIRDFLEKRDPSRFKVPSVVYAELLHGAKKSRNPQKNRALVERIVEPYEIVPFDSSCALAYANTRAYLECEGQIIDPNDLMIAAIVLTHGGILVTRNAKELSRVPGLELEEWYEQRLG